MNHHISPNELALGSNLVRRVLIGLRSQKQQRISVVISTLFGSCRYLAIDFLFDPVRALEPLLCTLEANLVVISTLSYDYHYSATYFKPMRYVLVSV